MQASKRAYRGRVVQMDAAFSVLKDAVIWIEGNRIKAVLDAAATPPQGFEHMTPINTGGTFYPGLIELHNHLGYDILKLWDVPKLYCNRGQWQGSPPYQAGVSGPMGVLGKTPGVAPAIARYTEAKCLMGGTTTSQGITLFSAPGLMRQYRGIVRNVEESLDSTLPDAKARIPDYAAKDKDNFLGYLKDFPCLLMHLSEGIDASARKHFLDLEISPNVWAIAASLTGIHCNALTRKDFDRLAAVRAGMVWSPLSNFMLYGQTADIKSARAAGVRIGLGSDWSPSGSKNLLHELKVVRVVNSVQALGFSDRDIVAMATIVAAGLLRWDRYLGSIEAGKYADLVLVRGKAGDAYEHLLKADETRIDLVVVDGLPRYAIKKLTAGFSGTGEVISFAGETRYLNLDDANADEIVAGLSLKVATKTLSNAMKNLPTLAKKQAKLPPSPLMTMAMDGARRRVFGQGPTPRADWTLVLDQDEPPDENLRPRFDSEAPLPGTIRMSAMPTATKAPAVLKPLELDELTVTGDPGYYPALAGQRNIPQAIKDGLQP
ncbi:amidohydrolase family protein [Mesorhizobium sp. M0309]|uniref:amidohydrolase family protein n=1 Tax=Mesorhizobium sp. M0309 TaxID=2956933 RepID=UPI0033357515